eukprot:TRINITY_DN5332_c0_g1_i3.p1 TRINITY_DN5332_c0_g1~~TRINITY_DN5332_c0_g1_i3.p1  ORF type:complete len:3105 (-),score=632.94 TRINITY_DN5332_c0_g1_i3:269-8482(-)
MPISVIHVDAGARTTCVIVYNGDAYCFGSNEYGELGVDGGGNTRGANWGPPSNIFLVPQDRIIALGAGENHWCAWQASATVSCFGDASHGETGTGLTTWVPARSQAALDVLPVASVSISVFGATATLSSLSASLNFSTSPLEVTVHGFPCRIVGFTDSTVSFTIPSLLPIVFSGRVSAGGIQASFLLPNFDVLSSAPVLAQGQGMDTVLLGLTNSDVLFGWNSNSAGQLGLGRTDAPNFATRLAQNAERVAAYPPAMDVAGLKRVILGGESACALRRDGQLYCWGRGILQTANFVGDELNEMPPASVNDLLNVTDITEFCFGQGFLCILNSNGDVVCAGDNTFGQRGVPAGSPVGVSVALNMQVTAIACGAQHVCALAAGDVRCWGRNQYGQLGIGSTVDQGLGVMPPPLSNVSSLQPTQLVSHSESSFSCAVASRSVYCWGQNNFGQLGTKNTENVGSDVAFPYVAVDLRGPATYVSFCGNQSVCALLEEGIVQCWGYGLTGQLGSGGFVSRGSSPADFPLPVVLLPHGAWALGSSSAILVDGDIYSWGNGVATPVLAGAPPLLTSASFSSTNPVSQPGVAGDVVFLQGSGFGTNTTAVRVEIAGVDCPVAIADSTRLSCTLPTLAPGTYPVTVTRAGHARSNALMIDVRLSEMEEEVAPLVLVPNQRLSSSTHVFWPRTKYLLAAGAAAGRQQGVWPLSSSSTFERAFLRQCDSAAVGPQHSCCVDSLTIFCFGRNDVGQLGLDNTVEAMGEPESALLDIFSGPVGVAVGTDHTCVFSASWLKCFGGNAYGQLGRGSNASPFDNVGDTAGEMASILAITLADNVTVVCGTHFTCVLSNFKVYCFGKNAEGQLGVAPSAPVTSMPLQPVNFGGPVLSLTAGDATLCALMLGGLHLRCVGRNFGFAPQSGSSVFGGAASVPRVPLPSVELSSVVLGANFLCVLTAAAAVKCVGSNAAGQFGTGSTTSVGSVLLDFPPQDSRLVNPGEGISSILAGPAHLCALTLLGTVRCAGNNTDGQLGSPAVSPVGDVPADLPPALSAVPPQIVAVYDHKGSPIGNTRLSQLSPEIGLPFQLFLFGSGFGSNPLNMTVDLGGLQSQIDGVSPFSINITFSANFFMLSGTFLLRVTRDGVVSNGHAVRVRFVEVTDKKNGIFLTPASGPTSDSSFVFAPAPALELYVAGSNQFRQLGLSLMGNPVAGVPQSSAAWGRVQPVALTAGAAHVCAISESNDVRCLGRNIDGETGQTAGDTSGMQLGREPMPVVFEQSGLNFTSICAGESHTCVTHSAGFSCFGANAYGQLGTGAVGGRVDGSAPIPVQTHDLGPIASVTCGQHHTCLWTSSAVRCFGRNDRGQLGIESAAVLAAPSVTVDLGSLPILKVAAGGNHNCALFGVFARFVRCWGSNTRGQLGIGAALPLSLGSLVGDMPPPALLFRQEPMDITLLADSTCVSLSDGSLQCCGANQDGQLGLSDTTDRSAFAQAALPASFLSYKLAGGANHVCALSTLGNLACFGNNTHGQLWKNNTGASQRIGDQPEDFPLPQTILPPWAQSLFLQADPENGWVAGLIGTGFFGMSGISELTLSMRGAPVPFVFGLPFTIGFFALLDPSIAPGDLSLVMTVIQADGVPRTGRPTFMLNFPFLSQVNPIAGAPGSTLTVRLSRYTMRSDTWASPANITFVANVGGAKTIAPFTISNQTESSEWVLLTLTVPMLPPSTSFTLVYITDSRTQSVLSTTARFETCTIGCAECITPGLSTAGCLQCDEPLGFYLDFPHAFCIDDSTGCEPDTVATNRGNTTPKHCGCDHALGLLLNQEGSACISGGSCPSGSYANVTIPDHQCLSCHASCIDCLGGAFDACISCPTGVLFSVNQGGGQTCVGSCSSCAFGLARDANNTCACPPGTFFFDGQCTTCIGDTYAPDFRPPALSQDCFSCPPFMMMPVNATHTSAAECICKTNLQPLPVTVGVGCGCPPGTTYSAEVGGCQVCLPNSYQPSWGTNLRCISCDSVGAHRVAPTIGQQLPSDCVCDTNNGFTLAPNGECLCRPGQFLVRDGCQQCPPASYSPDYNDQFTCVSCATLADPYRVTEANGTRDSINACVCPPTMEVHPTSGACTCPPGYFLEVATTSCRQCPADFFGTSWDLATTCESCEAVVGPLRVTRGVLGSNSSEACVCPFTLVVDPDGNCMCPAGYYFVPAEKGCRPCDADTYNVGFGNASRTTCERCNPRGSTRTTRGATGSTSAAACVCKEGFYPSRSGECRDCSELGISATCGGALSSSLTSANQSAVQLAGISVSSGFWLTTESLYLPAGVGLEPAARKAVASWFGVFKCPLATACPGGAVEENCAPGYSGPACGLCEDGFGRLGQECARCPAPGVSVFLSLLILALVIAGCIFVIYYAHPERLSDDSHSVALKISIMHLQIIGFTGNFASQWPETLARVFAVPASAATVSSASDNIAIDCAFSPTIYTRGAVIFVLPLILAAGVALFYLVHGVVRGDVSTVQPKIEQGTLVLLYVAHPGIVQGVLKLMVCVKVGTQTLARSDMSVDCTSSAFIALQTFASIYFVVYGFGGLLAVFLLMRRKPENWRFLSTGYHPDKYYWDLVVTLRQMLFVIVSLFASPPLQLFFGTWILLVSWIAESVVRPYKKVLHQKLVFTSIVVLLVTVCLLLRTSGFFFCFLTDRRALQVTVGNLFYNGVLDSQAADGLTVSVLLILLNFSAILSFIGLGATTAIAKYLDKNPKEVELTPF